ncbi:MAG: hypothetical protein FK731_06570 [Asgard group archaeon]|nr:hypothetical protein [Asgard group archaeon]
MRRPNGGVIWLLLAGAAMAFAFNQMAYYFLTLRYMIASFIILVIGGYICARVIGQAGGEFSDKVKNYSIILEGFVFGMVFELLRFDYDFFINVFKYIAIGTFFILIAMVFKRNLEKYEEKHPADGPHLGIMRLSILYILAGLNFGLTISSVLTAYLNAYYFIASLPILVGVAIFVMVSSKADHDLLSSESGLWQQLFVGGALGLLFDLILFKIVIWQDLLKLFVVFVIFVITGFVIRMKEATAIKTDSRLIEFDSKKPSQKKKIVGSIELEPKSKSKITIAKKKSPKSKDSSKRRR